MFSVGQFEEGHEKFQDSEQLAWKQVCTFISIEVLLPNHLLKEELD